MLNTALDFTQELTLEDEKKTVLAQADEIKIYTPDDYMAAKSFWAQVRQLRAKVKETFQPLVDQAHRMHKDAISKRDEFDKPLEGAEKKIKTTMEAYDREQAGIRAEEEARLREIARKQAEEKRLEEAAALEKMGLNEQASAILDAPIKTVAPALPKQERQAGDPIFRTVWKYRITNPDLVPREYLRIDDTKIGGVVRALKDATNIPGVEAYAERV
jgi:hypothetical protein